MCISKLTIWEVFQWNACCCTVLFLPFFISLSLSYFPAFSACKSQHARIPPHFTYLFELWSLENVNLISTIFPFRLKQRGYYLFIYCFLFLVYFLLVVVVCLFVGFFVGGYCFVFFFLGGSWLFFFLHFCSKRIFSYVYTYWKLSGRAKKYRRLVRKFYRLST